MAVIATDLEATGWVPPDEGGRYLRHPLRYGDAIFDRFDVEAIEKKGRRPAPAPRRAPACRCRNPYGRLEEGICWECGRRSHFSPFASPTEPF